MITSSERFYQNYYSQQKAKSEKFGGVNEIKNLKEFLPDGQSYIRPIPSPTLDPMDTFLTIYYHTNVIPRSPEEIEKSGKTNNKSIVCVDAMKGQDPGTDCLVCRVISTVQNSEKWSGYMDSVVKFYYFRSMYFSAILVEEKPKFSNPNAANTKEDPKVPFIASVTSDPVINKINRWIGLPGGRSKDGTIEQPFGPEERAAFAAALHPKTGRALLFEKKSQSVYVEGKGAQTRSTLDVSLGNRYVELSKETLAARANIDRLNKTPDMSAVRKVLSDMFPHDLLFEAKV